MKRWITLFVSFAVLCSALSLGVFADDSTPYENLYVNVNATASTDDFSTEINAAGALSDRCLTYNYNQKGKIKGFIFTLGPSKYFLIDFDIVGDDSQWNNNGGTPSCSASVNIPALTNNLFTISGNISILKAEVRTYYSPAKVHFSIYGVNNTDAIQSVNITYNNPIIITPGPIPASNNLWNTKFSNIVAITSPDFGVINSWLEDILTSLEQSYSEIVSLGDSFNTYYNEFHQYWSSLNTYIFQIFKTLGAGSNASTYSTMSLTYNNNGIGTWSTANQYFPNFLMVSMRNIMRYLQHHIDMENDAIQRGSNDAYDALSDEADYGSLIDFAGAGSAASWSTGSFVDGLDQTWSWFSIENKNMIDAVQPNRDEIYISIYDDTLAEYNRILGGD